MLRYTDPVRVPETHKREYLNFAVATSHLAGNVFLRRFRHDRKARNQGQGGTLDPVTIADRETERMMATSSVKGPRGPAHPDRITQLARRVLHCRHDGDCYAYALLAMGQVDIVVDADMHRWDVRAVIPMVTGAGGVITTADGVDASMGGLVVAAATTYLHAAARTILRSA